MSLHSRLRISLNRVVFTHVISFSLEEKVGQHAVFHLSVRAKTLERQLQGLSVIETSQNFLGQSCKLEIEDSKGFGYNLLRFEGIVTDVKGKKGNESGGAGDIINFVGMSHSVFLEDGPGLSSYLDKPLSMILQDKIRHYTNAFVKLKVQLQNDPVLPYTVQHEQSTFAFFQHLAAKNGEYLLYNNNTLYFGTPNIGDEVVLHYGKDLKDFELGLGIRPQNFSFYGSNYYTESTVKSNDASPNATAIGYIDAANSGSNAIYRQPNQRLFSTADTPLLQQKSDTALAMQKRLAEQQQISLTGRSSNTGISLGKIIRIHSDDGSFGSYRVTAVTHHYERQGTYSNTFTAVPLDIDIYPLTDVALKVASPIQVAKVKRVDDPEGMSRIKVQFPWQVQYNQTTPWLQVATPYAGGDRGLVMLPEVGDEVLINFKFGNVEAPFMQAALFTGVNKHSAWQTKNNAIKGITSRSGHSIVLEDTKGGEKITISDKNNNVIRIDTIQNSIEISALEDLSINAKNININAAEHMQITVGKDLTKSVGEQLNIMAKHKNVVIEKNLSVSTEKQEMVSEEMTLSSNSKNLTLVSGKMVDIQSSEKVKLY